MAWLDFAFLGVMLLSVLIGMFRGFVREALSLATWILAFIVALRFGPDIADRMQTAIHSPPARIAIGYALAFFGVLIIGALLTYLVSLLIRNSGLRPVDRMLGLGFGLVRGGLLIVAFVMIAGFSSLHEEPWWQQSRFAPQLRPAANSLQTLIPAGWLAYLQPPASKDGQHKSGGVTVSNSEH